MIINLNQEKEALDKVLSNLNELCEHNQNKENNTKTIIKIEEKLHKANNKFFELVSNKKQDIESIISKLPDSKRLEDIRENLQKHINVKDTNNIAEQASAAQLQPAETKPVVVVPTNNAISTTPPVTEEKTFTPHHLCFLRHPLCQKQKLLSIKI